MGKHVKSDLLTYPKQAAWNRQMWHVAPDYQIVRGVLREKSEIAGHLYAPLTQVELPTELQRMAAAEPSESLSPLEFARQFGLLGYDRLASNPRSMEKVKGTPAKKPRGGDPLDWIQAHARTVRFCVHFLGLLEEDDDPKLQWELEQVSPGPYAMGLGLFNLPVDDIHWGLKHDIPAAALVRQHISRIVSENIADVRRFLFTDMRCTRIESFISFHGMIEAVYWQLADRIDGGGIRRCLACKEFFVARDKRQQYCPPFPGSTRSRCSSRLNVQTFRSRQQEE